MSEWNGHQKEKTYADGCPPDHHVIVIDWESDVICRQGDVRRVVERRGQWRLNVLVTAIASTTSNSDVTQRSRAAEGVHARQSRINVEGNARDRDITDGGLRDDVSRSL